MNHHHKGLVLVMCSALFWGVSGTVAKRLFELQLEVDWLVTTRLLFAGLLLLAIQLPKARTAIFDIWKSRRSAAQLLLFALFGMLATQYTYMASIQAGNAAVATLLQYLAPVMIIVYLMVRYQTVITKYEAVSVLFTLMGSFLLLTNGSFEQLVVPFDAAIWGILSAVAAAFYTLYARNLITRFGSVVTVGWAMFIGGCGWSLIHPPWKMDSALFTVEVMVFLVFVVVFGTMLAFWFYVESLQSLSPQEASLLVSLEPLMAVLTTVFWLNEPFGLFQWIGSVCIILVILLLTTKRKPAVQTEQAA